MSPKHAADGVTLEKTEPRHATMEQMICTLSDWLMGPRWDSALAGEVPPSIDNVVGSALALLTATLIRNNRAQILLVFPQQQQAEEFLDDLPLFTDVAASLFPLRIDEGGIHQDSLRQRLQVLGELSQAPQQVVACGVAGLLQPVPSRQELSAHSRELRVGGRVEMEELCRWLVDQAYVGTSAVEMPGEFARRGGLLDVYPIDADMPYRLEFFGDELESLRQFNVASQRSQQQCERLSLTSLAASRDAASANLRCHFADDALCMLVEPEQTREEAERFLHRHAGSDELFRWDACWALWQSVDCVTASAISSAAGSMSFRLPLASVQRFSGQLASVRDELDESLGDAGRALLACQTDGEIRRLKELFATSIPYTQKRIEFVKGQIHTGFELTDARVALIGSGQLFKRSDPTRRVRKHRGKAIQSFLDLRDGDLVVHLSHGIGRYRGLKELDKHGQVEEHLEIEFRGGTRVFVPAAKIDLVQKYVGGRKARPQLARLGGKQWQQQKQAAERAVKDLAADLLQIQAERETRPGVVCERSTEWQLEFDAAFPYQETEDQLAADDEIKLDLSASRPMDRLLCGDVGFGKTEIAMRAAFKAVDNGYQAALLAPTTILVEQHFRTFSERMSEFPFRIARLSRFVAAREQKEIVKQLQNGEIDIVIGTHRLASKDVQFQNLGLLMIDEEQRFGVEVKEHLKQLRTTVNVLTLSATPIPRTLHMSLTGMRDISNLETPPAERLAVETRVTRWSNDLIRQAVMRELDRGGQIFFVHNRVQDIESIATRLGQIVPEARLQIGHGQMPEGELERVMLDFIEHRFDLLLATTIVESGLDIPNANTIFIDEAGRYGLAELHQLRGRVGRYKNRAYCYLLLDPRGTITPTAARRLQAIEEFSQMGAGFAIAMRDLEIRGAGNILGSQQSGHIATVGYELYCQLLEVAVRQLKKLPVQIVPDVTIDLPGEALIPHDYVPDLRTKIDLYRRVNQIADDQQLATLREELLDRFGNPPESVERLMFHAAMKLDAAMWSIHGVRWESPFVVFEYGDPQRAKQLQQKRGKKLRNVEGKQFYCQLASDASVDQIEQFAKSMLRWD